MKLIILIAKKTWGEIIDRKASKWMIVFLNTVLLIVTYMGNSNVVKHNDRAKELKKEVRRNWENNPDKHPHRMAHYGYVVFRTKYPLSFFDTGLDTYVGNSIFLEAHKQNTVNFSEASFTDNLLRFGDISASMIFQLLIPLLIFVCGYGIVARERESETLKLLIIQGASWQKILLGKSTGLFLLSLTVILPIMVLNIFLLVFNDTSLITPETYLRYGLIVVFYFIYFSTLSLFTVLTSTITRSSKLSLSLLLGYWLCFIIAFPKISQVIGQSIFPSSSKVEFDIAVENETLKHGDSHNPDDSYFKNIKDSLLLVHRVSSVQELPFNYSGFIMKEGEKLNSKIYNRHKSELVQTYLQQYNFVKWMSLINPYIAINSISMALSGTDYQEYDNFQSQAENYRYFLAQTLNDLHIKYVANDIKSSADKRAALSKKYWQEIKDFNYKFIDTRIILKQEVASVSALFMWFIGLAFLTTRFTKYY